MPILGLLLTAFWLWMIIDFFQRMALEEGMWTIVVFFSPLGALIYFFGSYLPHVQTESSVALKGKQLKRLQAIGENHLPPGSLKELGDLYRQRGRWAEAVPCYERALSFLVDQHSMRLNLARCLIELGKTDEAIPHLRQVVDCAPYYGEEAALLLSDCLARAGRWDDAVKELQPFVSATTSLELKYHYSLYLLKSNRSQEAKVVLEDIIRQAPLVIKSQHRYVSRAKQTLQTVR